MKVCSSGKRKILKRLFSFALTLVFCVPLYVQPLPAQAAKTAELPDTLTPEMAEAFAEYLETNISAAYGAESVTLNAAIETLGPDRYPVLRFIWHEGYDMFSETILLYRNGNLEEVEHDMDAGGTGLGVDREFFVSKVDGINYYIIHAFGSDGWQVSDSSYKVFTVESNQWKNKIEFSCWQESVTDENYEIVKQTNECNVTVNGNTTPISIEKYEQYVAQYTGVSKENNLLSAQDLLSALQSFSVAPKYDLTDISYSLDDKKSTYFNDLISFVFFKHGARFPEFDSAIADNESLFGMAEYLLAVGIIEAETDNENNYTGEVSYVEFDDGQTYTYETTQGLRSVPCDTINRHIERFTGRTIDFKPYQVDHMLSGKEISQQVNDHFVVSFIYNNTFYQAYSNATYLMVSAKIQNLYQINDNMFWSVSTVSWDAPDAGYTELGEVSAIHRKIDENYQLVKVYELNEVPSIEEIQQYSVTPARPQNAITNGQQADAWALSQVNEAIVSGLVPDNLGSDLRVNITREQFASIAVRLYEAMSGAAIPAPSLSENHFTDTSNVDVRKAYALGLVSGTSSTTFSPNDSLTREQAAVMLTSVYRQLGGIINVRNPGTFTDDVAISGWARNSVYFMAENNIVYGVGNNSFDPQGKIQSQAALVIALRVLQTLK